MTPTLAQALSLIAPQYNAAQHKRAAERMVQDMGKTRTCPRCGGVFEIRSSRLAKSDYRCAACVKAYNKEYRQRRKDLGLPTSGSDTWDEAKKRDWTKRYYSKPEVKAAKASEARRRTADTRQRHKLEARWKVARAILAGRLVRKPCEVCGNEKSHAHHDDYSRPLEVRWMCRPCHTLHHKKSK